MASRKRPSHRAPLAISDTALDSFRNLVAGIAAAPPAINRSAWLELLPSGTDQRIKQGLLVLEAQLRAAASEQEPLTVAARVSLLRAEMKRQGLNGLIVPHADRQQCEYTPDHD